VVTSQAPVRPSRFIGVRFAVAGSESGEPAGQVSRVTFCAVGAQTRKVGRFDDARAPYFSFAAGPA
jgi:hypothetical protein